MATRAAKKHVLITGTSTGIGYSVAEALCLLGHQVWAGVRSTEALDRLAERFPHNLHILKFDVTSESDIVEAYKRISSEITIEEFVLINNAGVAIGGPCESLSMETWHNIFEVNLFGVINVTKHFLPLLRRNRGRVINIGSISGRIASPFLAPYAASKFALRAFSDSLRREVIDLGVQVVLIEAGPVRTEIWSKSLRKSADLEKNLSPELQAVYGDALNQLRLGVEKAAKDAISVDEVKKQIVEAVETKRPAVSYLVGKSIRSQAFLAKHLPPRALDRLISYGFRFQKGNE